MNKPNSPPSKDFMAELDVRGGNGLELLKNAQLYRRKPPLQGDWEDEMAVNMRSPFVRAIECGYGTTRVISEQEVAIAAIRRVVVGDTTYYNHDIIAMAVNPDAVDEPTADIKVFRHWDFYSMYEPTKFPEDSDS